MKNTSKLVRFLSSNKTVFNKISYFITNTANKKKDDNFDTWNERVSVINDWYIQSYVNHYLSVISKSKSNTK